MANPAARKLAASLAFGKRVVAVGLVSRRSGFLPKSSALNTKVTVDPLTVCLAVPAAMTTTVDGLHLTVSVSVAG